MALNLIIKKCQFLKKEIKYLGYTLSGEGVTISARHTEAIKIFPQPTNAHEVQRFLGLASYFRKFIKNFALTTKPLYNLLKRSEKFIFDVNCKEAFETLKEKLTSYPVLRLHNPQAEIELHTDASAQDLVAILMQKQNTGQWIPVSYYSQSTNRAEKNYHSFELEMLSIVRTVERFHIYLYD